MRRRRGLRIKDSLRRNEERRRRGRRKRGRGERRRRGRKKRGARKERNWSKRPLLEPKKSKEGEKSKKKAVQEQVLKRPSCSW